MTVLTRPSWYEEKIEEPIRNLVRILRENGFNTTSSCGHELNVMMEFYRDDDITRLYNLLEKNGYHHFQIRTSVEVRGTFNWRYRRMEIILLVDKNGEYDHGLEPLKGG